MAVGQGGLMMNPPKTSSLLVVAFRSCFPHKLEQQIRSRDPALIPCHFLQQAALRYSLHIQYGLNEFIAKPPLFIHHG